MPPGHTLIIKGHITSSISNTTRQRIDRHLRHHIITRCGDANVMMGSKHIDPALCTSSKKVTFRCKMKQIPANSNHATTGHKLQGMSKDAIIVSSWPTGSLAAMFKNWEYVILSCVRTLSGLYLAKPIDMDKSFELSPQLTSYMDKIRTFKKDMLEKCQQAITKTFS